MSEEGPKLSEKLTLVTSWVCPYAQRVLIALAEKSVPFDQVELARRDPGTGQWAIPLGDAKPSWLTSLAPEGKVPTVLYKEDGSIHVVTESLVILEFVEDYGNAVAAKAAAAAAGAAGAGAGASAPASAPGTAGTAAPGVGVGSSSSSGGGAPPSAPSPPPSSLLPPHPATRAAARLAAKRFDERFVPPFYSLLRGNLTPEARAEAKAALTRELEWLELHADAAGPYYCGAQFSLADAALIPFFLRMFELKARSGFEIPARCQRLIRWYGACASRQSVIGTLTCPDDDDDDDAEGGAGGGAGGKKGGADGGEGEDAGNDWEAALTKFFVGYLGPRPESSSSSLSAAA